MTKRKTVRQPRIPCLHCNEAITVPESLLDIKQGFEGQFRCPQCEALLSAKFKKGSSIPLKWSLSPDPRPAKTEIKVIPYSPESEEVVKKLLKYEDCGPDSTYTNSLHAE